MLSVSLGIYPLISLNTYPAPHSHCAPPGVGVAVVLLLLGFPSTELLLNA